MRQVNVNIRWIRREMYMTGDYRGGLMSQSSIYVIQYLTYLYNAEFIPVMWEILGIDIYMCEAIQSHEPAIEDSS